MIEAKRSNAARASKYSFTNQEFVLFFAEGDHAQSPLTHQRRVRKQLIGFDFGQRHRVREGVPDPDLYLRILRIGRIY